MERKDPAAASYSTSFSEQLERGGGGKFRKPPSRRPSAPPYARPPPSQAVTGGGGGRWISKLVNPARRLIASGASHILPSLFSKSNSSNDELSALSPVDDHDTLATEVERGTSSSDQDITLNDGISEKNEGECSKKLIGNFDEHKQLISRDVKDDLGVSEIEKLVEGKKFSRDEIDRLIRIINSRVADHPSPELKKQSPITIAREEILGPSAVNDTPRNYFGEKKQEIATALGGTWTPHQPTPNKLQDKVGASPIDIAKAYMERRASDVGINSKGAVTTGEQSDGFALETIVPSPSPKSAICWPGSIGKEQPGYLTPHTTRARYGLQRFSRTPYSRNINSNSKSKFPQVQGDSNRRWNGMSTPLHQLQTSSKQKVDVQDGNGSVGPIRRTRQKLSSERPPRGSSHFNSPLSSPYMSSSAADGFLSAERNLEIKVTEGSSHPHSVYGKSLTSQGSVPTIPPRSSHIARKILEHLERNPPTPRDKAAELKSVIAWNKSSTSDINTGKQNEGNGLLHNLGINSDTVDLAVKKFRNLDKEVHSFLNVGNQDNAVNVPEGIKSKAASASGVVAESSVRVHVSDFAPTDKMTKEIKIQSSSKQEDLSRTVPNAWSSEISKQSTGFPSHSIGPKTTLPSISFSKPLPTWAYSDGSTGFTFPVSKSAGISSEPPTPSIMPLCTNSSVDQPTETLDVPSYEFGSKRSSPALVFSFPSTSSVVSEIDDSTEIRFEFGSDTKSRISFSSIVEDAVCC